MNSDRINLFQSHLEGMRSLFGFFATSVETIPPFIPSTVEKQAEVSKKSVDEWMNFNCNLYESAELYSTMLPPLPSREYCHVFDQSDGIKERRGRNGPFFDFIASPLTHPLGTQISLVCISYCWNAYDTFIKLIIGDILQRNDHHPNVVKYKAEKALPQNQNSYATEAQLRTLEIMPDEADLEKFARTASPNKTVEQLLTDLKLTKLLRSTFTHRFGEANHQLKQYVQKHQFSLVRVLDNHIEAHINFISDACDIVQAQALIINDKATTLYI